MELAKVDKDAIIEMIEGGVFGYTFLQSHLSYREGSFNIVDFLKEQEDWEVGYFVKNGRRDAIKTMNAYHEDDVYLLFNDDACDTWMFLFGDEARIKKLITYEVFNIMDYVCTNQGGKEYKYRVTPVAKDKFVVSNEDNSAAVFISGAITPLLALYRYLDEIGLGYPYTEEAYDVGYVIQKKKEEE